MSVAEEGLAEYHPGVTPATTFWRQASEGTYYWRILVPARHFPAKVNALLHEDARNPDPLARQDGDVAVWQFLGDLARTRFAARVQSAGVRCFMEIDDNYLVPPPFVAGQARPWETTVRRSWRKGSTGYSHQAHRKILPSIDGLIVSTDVLADQYDGLVPAGIHVCPNSVDPDDWPEIEPKDRKLTVGFAGSASHYSDLAIVERALGWAAQKCDLVNVGGAGRKWPWPHTVLPWTNDLAEYRRNLQSLDVGLCPLKRSEWHDCKSDIKAMEYLMAGVLPIVQADSPCFKDWIGIVPSASTEKQWERVVKEIISLDADERYALWRRAYDYLLEHKTIGKHIGKWRKAIR